MTTERRELSARYDAGAVEPAIYDRWLAAGAFTPAAEPPGAERFVITQPPPNVTGALHIGHALTATVEDILIRYHRMRGDDTLWLPGVDHASIAAQFVLDQIIADGGRDPRIARPRALPRAHVALHGRDPRHDRRCSIGGSARASTGSRAVHDGRR